MRDLLKKILIFSITITMALGAVGIFDVSKVDAVETTPPLKIEVTAPEAALPGATIKYTIKITNQSGSTLTNIKVKHVIDSNLTGPNITYSKASNYTYDSSNNTWNIKSLNSDTTITIEAKVSEGAAYGSKIISTATIEAYTSGGTVISADPQPTSTKETGVGISVAYKFVNNPSPSGAENVLPATAFISPGSKYEAAAAPTLAGYIFSGWYTDKKCNTRYSTTELNTNTILYGKWSPTFTVTNYASTRVGTSGTINYTIRVKNNSTKATYTEVVVSDKLPDGVTFKEDTSYSGVHYDEEGKTWTIDSIPASSERQINFTATAPSSAKLGDSLTNTAYVTKYTLNSEVREILEANRPSAQATTIVGTQKTVSVETSKTSVWTEGKTDEEININIEEQTLALATNTPKILFLGTLCSAHSMEKVAVVNALEASTKYGDVDYYLFQRLGKDTSDLKTTNIGTLKKGVSVTDIEKKVSSPVSGYHASLYDFASVLQGLTVDDYDFIVMEFDGMRLGHIKKNNLYPTDDDIANLNKSASVIKQYYKAGKVAWVIPEVNLEGDTYTSENKYIYNDCFFDKDDTNSNYKGAMEYVRESIKLLAPEDLVDGKVSGTLEKQENLIRRTSEGNNQIWVYYNDAEKVKIFLDNKLGNRVEMEDVVAEGLTVTNIKGQYKEIVDNKPSGSWKDIDANNTWDGTGTAPEQTWLSYAKTVKKDGTTSVSADFDLSKIYSNYEYGDANNVRLIITCEVDKNEITTKHKKTGSSEKLVLQTNVGDAVVKTITGGKSIENTESTPELKVDSVTVKYKYVGKSPSGSVVPNSAMIVKGSKYNATPADKHTGWTFSGWYTDPACTIAYVDGTEINEDTILYGKWTKNLLGILATGDGNMLLFALTTMIAALIAAVLILLRRRTSGN